MSSGALAAIVVLVGIVLSPVRVVAATIPALLQHDLAIRSTATTLGESEPSLRPERGDGRLYAYDGDRCDGAWNPHVTGGIAAVHAYDDALDVADWRAVGEGVICGARVTAPAAECRRGDQGGDVGAR